MSGKTDLIEQSFQGVFTNIGTLIVAAVFFAASFAISGLPGVKYDSLSGFVNINTIVTQLVAGICFIIGIILAFIRAHIGHAATALTKNLKAVGIGATLYAVATLFIGLANNVGTAQPLEGAILGFIGYGLLLVSIVVSGTMAGLISIGLSKDQN